ncbi:MAG TPA: hypothetical protein PLX06_07645, partial [Fimbriimonadaceae bacterium]|nr:hypothetical protein [Fimbriimonadaceae bacterium]
FKAGRSPQHAPSLRALSDFAAQLLSASLGGAKAVKVEATQEHYLDGRSGAIQLAARAARHGFALSFSSCEFRLAERY